jgi:hypothetical protein
MFLNFLFHRGEMHAQLNLHLIFNRGEAYFSGAATTLVEDAAGGEADKP